MMESRAPPSQYSMNICGGRGEEKEEGEGEEGRGGRREVGGWWVGRWKVEGSWMGGLKI